MGKQYLGCFCRIYEHKDIMKELENTDFLHSLILDKFTEKKHGAPTLFSKRIKFLLFLFCSKLEKRSLSLQFICTT